MENNIKFIWNELRKNTIKKDETPFVKRDYKKIGLENPVYFMIAKSSLTNECGILIQSSYKNFPEKIEKPLSDNFKLDEYEDDSDTKYLWFRLNKDNIYEDLFEIICADLVDKSINQNNERNSILKFLNGIIEWQDFLKLKKNQLSDSKLKGLFSELIFMKNFIINSDKIKNSIKSWKPFEDTHDFLINNVSVEIKSTTTSPIKKIKINSIKQLDETLTKKLFLVLVHLKENSGLSLPELISQIREYLKKNTSDLYYHFESKLLKEGYQDEHKEFYKDRKFSVINFNFFKIDDDFPRIRDKDLKEMKIEGIINAQYEINYSSFENKKIETEKFKEEII